MLESEVRIEVRARVVFTGAEDVLLVLVCWHGLQHQLNIDDPSSSFFAFFLKKKNEKNPQYFMFTFPAVLRFLWVFAFPPPPSTQTVLRVVTQRASLLTSHVEILQAGEMLRENFNAKLEEGAKKDIIGRMTLDPRIHAGAAKAAERKYGPGKQLGGAGAGGKKKNADDDDEWDD